MRPIMKLTLKRVRVSFLWELSHEDKDGTRHAQGSLLPVEIPLCDMGGDKTALHHQLYMLVRRYLTDQNSIAPSQILDYSVDEKFV